MCAFHMPDQFYDAHVRFLPPKAGDCFDTAEGAYLPL